MKRLLPSWAYALVLCALPVSAAAEPLVVVTTTEDLASIVRSVGGEDVRVRSITRGSQDPHHIDAKPSHMTVLRKAELLVYVGLELEAGWLPLLIDGARNPQVRPGRDGHLDASTVIKVLDRPTGEVDRSHGDVHPSGNPHYWLDPRNALAVAAEVERRIVTLRPKLAEAVSARGAAYRAKLQGIIDTWQSRAASLRGTRFVAYHATFRYLAHWLGLKVVARIEERPGIPPAPRHVARLVALMKDKPVVGILSTRYDPRATVHRVASQTGAKPLFLPTSVGALEGVDSYEALLEAVLSELMRSLP